ncbi:MAG TPA: peptidylprolyl isomerase [Bdellovibrionota bacterium]|jgi:parvulin-like peptidyl-prolyl isomerase
MRKVAMKLLVLGCMTFGLAHAAVDPNVVADVNGKKISKDEFERRYKENISFFRYGAPTKENVLNDIINFELTVQEAHRLGLEKDPQIQERMNAVLYQAVVERQLSGKFKGAVDVSESEAKSYCKKNPSVRISHIFVPLKPAALKAEEESANKKMKALQAELAKGTKFEKVVAGNADQGFSASTGGDTGYANKVQLDPAVYAEARRLSVGEVSHKAIRSQMGLHIVKLTGVQDCGSINVPEWQRMVFDEKRAKILQDYLSTLRSRAKVSVNDELIKE